MIKKSLISLIPVLTLSGCVNPMKNPFLADVIHTPDNMVVSKEEYDQTVKVSYLSRSLMEDDNRAAIERLVIKSKNYTNWTVGSAAQAGTMAQMSTDLAVGQFNSGTGAQVGAATFGAGLVLGQIFDGSHERASKAWIPSTFEGKQVKTEEQAQNVLRHLSEQQIQQVANAMGWSFKCVIGCDSKSRKIIYYLSDTSNHPLHADYLYKPENIAIKVSFNKLRKVADNDPIHVLISSDIEWETTGANSYWISLMGGIVLDDTGKPKINRSDSGDESIRFLRDIQNTHIGRDILRTFHSEPYTFQGDAEHYPYMIYYDDNDYFFSSNSTTIIASRRLKETYLLDGKAPVTTPKNEQTPVEPAPLK